MKLLKIRRVGNSNMVALPKDWEADGFGPGTYVLVEREQAGRRLTASERWDRVRYLGYACRVKRVLITGMSGTGKSTIIRALAARGYKAVDLDSDAWSHWVPAAENDPLDPPSHPESAWQSRDWVWREDRVARLLARQDVDVLFVSGTAANQGKFHPQFDHIVLLSAPTSVLLERLASRATNDYGKESDELVRVLQHIETVEPLLRRAASLEVDTSVPLDQVLRIVEDTVQTRPPGLFLADR